MDTQTYQELEKLGIDGNKVPEGEVKFLTKDLYCDISEDTQKWVKMPQNDKALAYRIETEVNPSAGILLRNLYTSKKESSRLTVTNGDGPYWHNFRNGLKLAWEMGVAVIVEGPKDARFLYQYDIPAIAYLGANPGKAHISILSKYLNNVIWIPDNEDLQYQVKEARKKALEEFERNKVRVTTIKIAAKDAGELKGNNSEIKRIQKIVKDISKMSGSGYNNVGNKV